MFGESPKPQPLSVAHVVLSLDVGGLERVVLDLVRAGVGRGHRVAVVCLERAGALGARAEEFGAELVVVGKPPGLRPELIGQLRGVFRRLAPTVVHTHQIGALLYAGPAARRERVPLVVHTEHSNHVSQKWTASGRMRIRLLWGLAGRHASRFFCVSEDIAEAVRASGLVPRRKIVFQTNGIPTALFACRDGVADARRLLGIPEGAPVIGSVGRLTEVKRQDRLIQAFRTVLEAVPTAYLVLIGDGPLRSELEDLARQLGLTDRTRFAGYRPDPVPWLGLMSVFALTSRVEGMPLAILEAWASAVPVVATAVGGIPQIIEHDRTGLLVDPEDESGLASALIRLLLEPDRASRLASAGREQVLRDYDVNVMAEGYERYYRDGLNSIGARSR